MTEEQLQSIEAYVNEFVDRELQERGEADHYELITKVVDKNSNGTESDRMLGLAAKGAKEIISASMRRCKGRVSKFVPEQLRFQFKGFVHLQHGYPVSRDGRQITVRIDLLTAEEIASKYFEHEGQERGHGAHKRELKQLCIRRFGKDAWENAITTLKAVRSEIA